MFSLPLEFKSEARATSSVSSPWTIQSPEQTASCAIPTEFGGAGGGFSPEDLFLQSAINCFVGTFKVIAQKSRLTYSEIHVTGKLIVDTNPEGQIVMKSVHLEIMVSGADRPDRLPTLVNKVARDGFILNSIRSNITFSLITPHSISTDEHPNSNEGSKR